jgi:hypothetical protein
MPVANSLKSHFKSPYRRAAGSVAAFLVVSLFVKYAQLLFTEEHRVYLPASGGLVSRASQLWLSLRFSWQEFLVGAGLFFVVALGARARRPADRSTRVTWGTFRVALLLFSVIAVLGLAYYDVYQAPVTTDDLEYLRWTFQLVATSSIFDLLSVRIGLGLIAVLYLGLPWLVSRVDRPLSRPAMAVIAGLLAAAGITYVAGRPNLAEALLEPHPTVWLLAGHRVRYTDLPPQPQLAPVGPHERKFSPGERPKNVIVVVLESTPAASVFPYSEHAPAGRRLFAEFGDEVTLFEHVYANVPNSGSSFFSAMMGRGPIPSLKMAEEEAAGLPSLSEILKARGFDTAMYLNGDSNISMSGLSHRGFDRVLDSNVEWPGQERYVKMLWGRDERMLFDEARRYLEARGPEAAPFFLLLYTSNPHAPYPTELIPGLGTDPDPKVRHRLMVKHDVDLMTDLYAWMKTAGIAETTALIAYGDHGEAFNEHPNNIIHSKALFEENVHVPFMLLHPRRLGLPTRIGQLGSLEDLLPTIADLLGVDVASRYGMSLLFEAPAREVFAVTDYGPGQLALRDARFSYLLSRNGRELLFDRQADPGELTNVADRHPDVIARFRSRIRPGAVPGR